MQREGQIIFAAETTAVGPTLDFLAARGIISGDLEVRAVGDRMSLEVLGPLDLQAPRALEIGAGLAALPASHAVSVVALAGRAARSQPALRYELGRWMRSSQTGGARQSMP